MGPSLPIELITDAYVAFLPISDSKILMRAHVKRPCRRERDVKPPKPAAGLVMRPLYSVSSGQSVSSDSESTSLDRGLGLGLSDLYGLKLDGILNSSESWKSWHAASMTKEEMSANHISDVIDGEPGSRWRRGCISAASSISRSRWGPGTGRMNRTVSPSARSVPPEWQQSRKTVMLDPLAARISEKIEFNSRSLISGTRPLSIGHMASIDPALAAMFVK